jgi:2,3-diaminopropionate biosynthesis protein SbnB
MKAANNLRIVTGANVDTILAGKEQDIINLVGQTYALHAKGQTSVPFSTFLRFPEQPRNRIIGLPAYLNSATPVGGIKWVASFPGNIDHNLPRASALLILNSMETGFPVAVVEASLINAKRTAASAALAAKELSPVAPGTLSLIGCGPINFEVAVFCATLMPSISLISIYDPNSERAKNFQSKLETRLHLKTRIDSSLEAALKDSRLVSFATNAGVPHIDNPELFKPGCVVLHVSLRDLSPSVLLSSHNFVDDVHHVNRENTSIHLTSQQEGNTDFVAGSLGQVLTGTVPRPTADKPIIFSPFGLGILDIAVGNYILEQGGDNPEITTIDNFLALDQAIEG